MENFPKLVSVIIPCYNSANWVAQTISSVLSQTYKNIEVIAINDGSTDNTLSILSSFEGSIQAYSHPDEKNHGQAATINLGLKYSKGKYIAFLDSDDMWAPEKIEIQVAFMEKYPDVGMVYTGGSAINETNEVLYDLFEDHHTENSAAENLLADCYIRTPSLVMIKRSVALQTGHFESNIQSSDHDYWLRIIEKNKVSYIKDPLVYYRRRKGQLSENRRQWEDGFQILANAKKRYPYSLTSRNKRKAVLYYRLASYDLEHEGKSLKTILLFTAAFIHNPARALKYLLERKM